MRTSHLVGRFLRSLRPRTAARRRPEARPAGGAAGVARTCDADPSRVRIVYAPAIDGDPDPGEVVWTWIPFEEDPRQGKDRPVVVVGVVDGGDRRLAAVALTSNGRERPDTFEIGQGRWDASGRPSRAKLDRILSVDPGTVRREGAVLDRVRFDALVRALEAHHGRRFGADRPAD